MIVLWASIVFMISVVEGSILTEPLEAEGTVIAQESDAPECPSQTKLCIVPIKLYFIEPCGKVSLQTNSGSNMLLQLQNESNVNNVQLMVVCGDISENVTLGVYAPDNLVRYNRNWGGCLLHVSNITPDTVPTEALVFLIGQ